MHTNEATDASNLNLIIFLPSSREPDWAVSTPLPSCGTRLRMDMIHRREMQGQWGCQSTHASRKRIGNRGDTAINASVYDTEHDIPYCEAVMSSSLERGIPCCKAVMSFSPERGIAYCEAVTTYSPGLRSYPGKSFGP